MKGKISVCAILAIGFLIFIIYGSTTIYGMRNQVIASEETLIGNIKEANDVNLELKYMDDSGIGWDVNYSINNNIQSSFNFKTFYYNVYDTNNFPIVSMSSGDFDTSKFHDQIVGDVGEKTIRIADYYEYLPIELRVSFDGKMGIPIQGESNFYKIKIPEDAELRIKKQYNSYYTEGILIPHVENIVSSVIIDGKIYFTITTLNNRIYYEKNIMDSLEYKLTSGILAIDMESSSYGDIEIMYPMNLENGDNKDILGITSVKNDEYLALATMEEQSIYIHLYDIKSNVLVKKEKVGEIPSNMIITQFDFISKEDNLLANYEYIEACDTEVLESLKTVGAVYNIADNNEINVLLENEYYSKLAIENKGLIYPEDMLYKNNKLHLVFRNNYYNHNYYTIQDMMNSIILLTMDEKEILYYGMIRNSMNEDFSIGDDSYTQIDNEEFIVRNCHRYLSSVKFVE